ncbi:MAG: MlaD family protein [Treponema sp.]|nr:MlaD family protein [Treponema sp.]
MKFKIRYADKIVGLFILISLVSIVLIIFMLGRSERWFARDLTFLTILPSAGGLSQNMPLQFRGFTIGNIRSFHLTERDDVEVTIIIYEEYRDRVRLGSSVEMLVSPIGLGNQFLFHAGRGEILEEGSFLPLYGSPQAQAYARAGLALETYRDDSINMIFNQVIGILDDLGGVTQTLDEALGIGSDETELGLIVGNIQNLTYGLNETIEGIQGELIPLLETLNGLTEELLDPDGLLSSILDTEGEVYGALLSSLASITGILDNLDRATATLPPSMAQVGNFITELRLTVRTAEDVLIALSNNPLLRGGIPERLETEGAAGSSRNIRF